MIHHVQLLGPPGSEPAMREFFHGVLGLAEIPKPPVLAARGAAAGSAAGRRLPRDAPVLRRRPLRQPPRVPHPDRPRIDLGDQVSESSTKSPRSPRFPSSRASGGGHARGPGEAGRWRALRRVGQRMWRRPTYFRSAKAATATAWAMTYPMPIPVSGNQPVSTVATLSSTHTRFSTITVQI